MDVELWTQGFDHSGFRWDSMTTNASKSFNKILKNGRDLPVASLVMYTFKQTAAYFVKRYESPYNSDGALFPPKIDHIVTLYNPVSRVFDVLTTRKHNTYKVYLDTRTCSCAKWTLFHYSCSHAMAACKYARIEYSNFIPIEYTLEAYYRTWSYFFNPLLHEDMWRPYDGPVHVPNPRYKRTKGGRPPTRRRRDEMDRRHQHLGEPSSQVASSSTPTPRIQRCKNCHQIGHNKRACPTRYPN